MKANFDATGSLTVITGGANGIGRAAALALRRAGGKVVVLDAQLIDAELDTAGVTGFRTDVAVAEQVEAAVAEVEMSIGEIDGLIAGAAIQPRTPVLEMADAEWRRVLSVNLDGVVWSTRAIARRMVKRRRGSIVVFTSGMALTGYRNASAYNASKAALIGYAKSLAAEVVDDRVRVNIVSPGVIDTPQFRAANVGQDLDHWQDTTGVGTPEDAVGPLMFLLSDAATMTGSQLTRERVYSVADPS